MIKFSKKVYEHVVHEWKKFECQDETKDGNWHIFQALGDKVNVEMKV